MSHIYEVVDDFQAGNTDIRVLVLNRDFDSFDSSIGEYVVIDGVRYPYSLNSVSRWISINSRDNFTGKTIEFV